MSKSTTFNTGSLQEREPLVQPQQQNQRQYPFTASYNISNNANNNNVIIHNGLVTTTSSNSISEAYSQSLSTSQPLSTILLSSPFPPIADPYARGTISPAVAHTSFISATLLGLFVVPFGISQSGWLSALFIPIMYAYVLKNSTIITFHLYNSRHQRVLRSLEDLVEAAFGSRVRLAVTFLRHLFKFCVCLACIAVAAEMINSTTLSDFGDHRLVFCAIIGVLVFAQTASRNGILLWRSLLVQGFTTLCILIVIASSIAGLIEKKPSLKSEKHELLKVENLPMTIAAISISFYVWSETPQIEQTFRNRGHFARVFRTMHILSCIITSTVGIATYTIFGNTIDSIMILEEHPILKGYNTIAKCIVCVPLIFLAADAVLEATRPMEPNRSNPYRCSNRDIVRHIVFLRLPTVGICAALAYLCMPYCPQLLTCIGGILLIPVVICIPMLVHVKLFYLRSSNDTLLMLQQQKQPLHRPPSTTRMAVEDEGCHDENSIRPSGIHWSLRKIIVVTFYIASAVVFLVAGVWGTVISIDVHPIYRTIVSLFLRL